MENFVINLIKQRKKNIEAEIAHHDWWINKKWFPKFWKNILIKDIAKLDILLDQCNRFLSNNNN